MNSSDGKNVLVIGGRGFIGTRLIERLLETGCAVKNYEIATLPAGQPLRGHGIN